MVNTRFCEAAEFETQTSEFFNNSEPETLSAQTSEIIVEKQLSEAHQYTALSYFTAGLNLPAQFDKLYSTREL